MYKAINDTRSIQAICCLTTHKEGQRALRSHLACVLVVQSVQEDVHKQAGIKVVLNKHTKHIYLHSVNPLGFQA